MIYFLSINEICDNNLLKNKQYVKREQINSTWYQRKQDNSPQKHLAPRQLAPKKTRPKTTRPAFRRQLIHIKKDNSQHVVLMHYLLKMAPVYVTQYGEMTNHLTTGILKTSPFLTVLCNFIKQKETGLSNLF